MGNFAGENDDPPPVMIGGGCNPPKAGQLANLYFRYMMVRASCIRIYEDNMRFLDQQSRGVARYAMKCKHNLRRGVCFHLAPPTGPMQSPGGGSGG